MLAAFSVSAVVVLTWPIRAMRRWLRRRRGKGAADDGSGDSGTLGGAAIASCWPSGSCAIRPPGACSATGRAGCWRGGSRPCRSTGRCSSRASPVPEPRSCCGSCASCRNSPRIATPISRFSSRPMRGRCCAAWRQGVPRRRASGCTRTGSRSRPKVRRRWRKCCGWRSFRTCTIRVAATCWTGRSERPAFEAFLADHIRKLILARGGRRYVSKNNYNLSRLSYLARVFPDARFLVPVARAGGACRVADEAARAVQPDPARQRRAPAGTCAWSATSSSASTAARSIRAMATRWPGSSAAGNKARRRAVGRSTGRSPTGTSWTGWQADAGLADRCLLVRYEDLCDRPVQTLSAVCAHIGMAGAHAGGLADGLCRPRYYAPRFSDQERAAIAEETAAVARRLGYGGT